MEEHETKIIRKKIDPKFLDLVNYGFCSALTRLYGKEKAESVFKLAGEMAFGELKKMISIKAKRPSAVLKVVAHFLEENGYITKINLTEVTENEVIIDMYGVSVAGSSKRLLNESAAPSHYMTNLMFAALKDLCDLGANITHLAIEIPEKEIDHVREKWVLSEIGRKRAETPEA